MIEHEGRALYCAKMFTIIDGVVVDEMKLCSGEFARNAVKRMSIAAMRLEIEGHKPTQIKERNVMRSVGSM